jgi:hypothetical protein
MVMCYACAKYRRLALKELAKPYNDILLELLLRDETIGPERARICANPRICCEFVIRIRVVGTNFNYRMTE